MSMPTWYCWQGHDVIVHLHVQPNARCNEWADVHGAERRIRITAPPVAGKANHALQRLLAETFDVPPSSVSILTGHASRHKKVLIRAPQRVLPDMVFPIA